MHGFLNLNKPEGISSAKAVAIIKRVLGVKKIGHTGTLDPLACGVLPLAIGEATKLAQYVVADRKAYKFTVQWGSATSTDDLEGEVTRQSNARPTLSEINAILPKFIGTISQRPPDFSAIKIKGQRAYKTAREGRKVEIPAREIEVHSLTVTTPDQQASDSQMLHETTFITECGKGTYIRSLARDMGEALGCFGHVSFLQRTSVGDFHLKDAISLDLCDDGLYKIASDWCLVPMGDPLDDILAVSFKPDQRFYLMRGQLAEPLQASICYRSEKLVRCIDAVTNEFFALGQPIGSLIKPSRVFNI